MELHSTPEGSDELITENAQLRSEVANLTEEDLRLCRALCGTKSEQMAAPADPKVGQEAGASKEDGSLGTGETSTESSQEAKQGAVNQEHKKPERRRLPTHLPREEKEGASCLTDDRYRPSHFHLNSPIAERRYP